MSAVQVLSPGDGYAIVCGLGIGFACVMIVISKIQTRYTHFNTGSSEEFTSASRSLKPGLLAAGIVSAATWAATLLNSATVTYLYGLSAHTYLEPIKIRFGTLAHAIFIFFGLGTNVLLTGQLITGGADTVVALTGSNIYASCILIPFTVVMYTMVGGIRATFFSDYAHTSLIFAILLAFMFTTYATNDVLGSPSKVWDLLNEAAKTHPIIGNAEGSYMTFRSVDGLVFGIIVIISGITTVFMDQAYWQRAVASRGSTAVKAYLLGGLSFMSVPWAFSTACALALVALAASPNSPVDWIANPGLVAPAAAVALMGASGATLLLIVLFLAVTSAASAELVAVASVIVYDIYLPYINPKATEKQVLMVTHGAVVGYGCFMAIIGIVFYEIGISLGWLYGLTGVMFSCAVAPVGFCIRTSFANKNGCIFAAVFSFCCSIAAWLVTAKMYYGVVDVASTGGSYPQLAGNAAGIIISTLICFITSFIWPDNYDFEIMRRHNFAPQGVPLVAATPVADVDDDLKKVGVTATAGELEKGAVSASDEGLPINNINDVSDEQLQKDFRFACWTTGISFFILCILVPAMAAIPKVFPKGGFTAWVVISFIWSFASIAIVVVWPVWESRAALAAITRGIINDVSGKGLVKV